MFYVRFSCRDGDGKFGDREFSRIVEALKILNVGPCDIDITPEIHADECVNFGAKETGLGLEARYVDADGSVCYQRAMNCSMYIMNADGKTIAEYHSYARPMHSGSSDPEPRTGGGGR